MVENQELWDVATAMWEWRIDPPEASLSQIGKAAAVLYRARRGKSPEKVETTNHSGPLRVLSVYAYRRQDLDLMARAAFQVFEKHLDKGRTEYRRCLAVLEQLQMNADIPGHVRFALAMLTGPQQPQPSPQQTIQIAATLSRRASVDPLRLPNVAGRNARRVRLRRPPFGRQ